MWLVLLTIQDKISRLKSHSQRKHNLCIWLDVYDSLVRFYYNIYIHLLRHIGIDCAHKPQRFNV